MLYILEVLSDAYKAILGLVISVIIYWKLFKKMGIESWKSIIPVYNEYVLFKKLRISTIYVFVPFIGVIILFLVILEYLVFLSQDEPLSTELLFLVILITVIILVFSITGSIKRAKQMAKAFNQTTGFAVGLFFLKTIFEAILAFTNNIKFDEKKLDQR